MTASGYTNLFACLDGIACAGLAVSGGADSMALMHLANSWQESAGKGAPEFRVLTVDHGLRAESSSESEWVSEQARALGLACTILRWKPGVKTSRIQEDARQARYDLMANHAHEHGIDALVTAHHLEDQAETVLMRLGRGSGIDGLAGIRAWGRWAGLSVLRPLLNVRKADLVATLEERGAQWIEDPSNDDARFERVRVRDAMKQLEQLGIGPEALARSARRLRRAAEALDDMTSVFLERHAQLADAGYCSVDVTALTAVPEEVALRALARSIQGIGGRISPPRLMKLEGLLEALINGPDRAVTLSGCRLAQEGTDLIITREAGRGGLGAILLEPGNTGLWDRRYHVAVGSECKAPVYVKALGQDSYGKVRARLGKAVTLPDRAAETLISFWNDGELLAVPPLGYVSEGARDAGCTARFVNGDCFR